MKEIEVLIDDLLRIELEAYIFKQKDGKITFGADNGFHDDIIMALVMSRECYLDNKFSGVRKIFF